MILLYNAIAGSSAEDKANAGGGSPAPPLISLSLVNIGPTVGGATGGSFNINAVDIIPTGATVMANAGHTVRVNYSIASPSGAAITSAVLGVHTPGVGANVAVGQLFSVLVGSGRMGDYNPWQDDPDPGTFGAAAADVALVGGAAFHANIDIVGTLSHAVTPNILYMQFFENSAGNGHTGGLPPPSFASGDPFEIDLIVQDSNGNSSTVVASGTLA